MNQVKLFTLPPNVEMFIKGIELKYDPALGCPPFNYILKDASNEPIFEILNSKVIHNHSNFREERSKDPITGKSIYSVYVKPTDVLLFKIHFEGDSYHFSSNIPDIKYLFAGSNIEANISDRKSFDALLCQVP